jgi:hypothetical protein
MHQFISGSISDVGMVEEESGVQIGTPEIPVHDSL